jgi:hypothetical protein
VVQVWSNLPEGHMPRYTDKTSPMYILDHALC